MRKVLSIETILCVYMHAHMQTLKADSESEIPCHTALSVLHLAFRPHFLSDLDSLVGVTFLPNCNCL